MKNNNENYIPERGFVPSPESVYIRFETYFIKIISLYRCRKVSVGQLVSAYIVFANIDFKFTALEREYEKIIFDELGIDNIKLWRNEYDENQPIQHRHYSEKANNKIMTRPITPTPIPK